MTNVIRLRTADRPLKVLIVFKYRDRSGEWHRDGLVIEVRDRASVEQIFHYRVSKIRPNCEYKIVSYFTQDGSKINNWEG